MPPLQFPFTTGIPPDAVAALQQLFAQLSRRKEQEAQAKAESERIKAQTQRGLGSAFRNIAVGGISGGITGGVGGAFAGALGVDPNLFTKREFNQRDIDFFGKGTDAVNADADAAYGAIYDFEGNVSIPSLNPSLGPLQQAGLGPPPVSLQGPINQQALAGLQLPRPSKKDFRTIYRQGLLQRQQQIQVANKQQADLQQKALVQRQKQAIEQENEFLNPNPERAYSKKHIEEFDLAVANYESYRDPFNEVRLADPPNERGPEESRLLDIVRKKRDRPLRKPKFDKNKFAETSLLDLPGGGRIMFDPTNNNKPSHIRTASKKGDDDGPLTPDEAFEQVCDPALSPEQIKSNMTDLLQNDRTARKTKAGILKEIQANEQRRQGRTPRTAQAAISNLARADRAAFPQPNLNQPFFPSAGGMPARPVRPPQAAPAQQPAVAQAQPAQQPQTPPVHPALAKIPPDRINQKAVEIIQAAGGTGQPITVEDMQRTGMKKSDLRKGQIVIIEENAYVWDGQQFVPLEKS